MLTVSGSSSSSGNDELSDLQLPRHMLLMQPSRGRAADDQALLRIEHTGRGQAASKPSIDRSPSL